MSAYGSYTSKWMKYDACPGCDGMKARSALTCRRCKSNASELLVSWKPCPGCGTSIRGAHTQCHECLARANEAKKPLCIDCGATLPTTPSKNRPVFRCRPCYDAMKRSQPLRLCSVDGCDRPHMAKGFCGTHYKAQRQRLHRNHGAGHRGNLLAMTLSDQPCQSCGYDRMASELHKITPAGGYRPGNMVALCARCHDEVERGITTCPTPLTETAILQLRIERLSV